jgi:hypothetical protein
MWTAKINFENVDGGMEDVGVQFWKPNNVDLLEHLQQIIIYLDFII